MKATLMIFLLGLAAITNSFGARADDVAMEAISGHHISGHAEMIKAPGDNGRILSLVVVRAAQVDERRIGDIFLYPFLGTEEEASEVIGYLNEASANQKYGDLPLFRVTITTVKDKTISQSELTKIDQDRAILLKIGRVELRSGNLGSGKAYSFGLELRNGN